MLYSGTFRSLDQSVDPRGSLYKVLIFTGYNPNDLNEMIIGEGPQVNVGPYPVKRIRVGLSGIHFAYRNIPDTDGVVNLTMTDHPFTVEYSGDTDNIHKPYRCSTATVSFLQENLNTDFINSIGNGVFVMLLKWKNEVVPSVSVEGDIMLNTLTGDVLESVNYVYYDPITLRQNRYFRGFLPWEYDWFCYDVEWVGFATPEMLDVEYDHITDRFSLNCQDALSTLQYEKFERTDQLETIHDTLIKMLNKLGTYRDVYITTSVHFNSITYTDLISYTIPLAGSAMKHIVHQQDNFIDEDGDPDKYLEVLEKMMDYLSLTAIPYKNSLWIVSNEGLAMGHTTYSHYVLDQANRPWTLPAEIPQETAYSYMGDVDITDTAILDGDSFCGGTDLSSNIIYNKVKVVCDEMRPEPLLPDLESNDNYEPEPNDGEQPIAKNVWSRYSTSTPGQYEEEDFHYFEGYFNRPAIDEIKFFRYPSPNILNGSSWTHPVTNWGYSPVEVTDDDLKVWHNMPIPSGPGGGFNYIEALRGVGTSWPDTDTTYWWSQASNMAMMIDYSDTSVNSKTEVPTTISFNRGILLETYLNYNNPRYLSGAGIGDRQHDWDDKTTFWNPMVYLKSKPFLGNGKQYLNISGSFIFYATSASPSLESWWPVPRQTRSSSYFKFDTNHNYVWMKIKCGNYYLHENGRNAYSWSATEQCCRIWCDNAGLNQNDDWRFKNFNIETTHRGVDGISVNLPLQQGYAQPLQLEIWIDRPLGPGSTSSWCCQSMLINELEVNIYSNEYVESRKRRNPDRDNTEYSNPILEGAIEERPEINLNHSSCDTAGLSYAETARKEVYSSRPPFITTRYSTNPKVFNEGAGHYGLPEQVKIETLRNQGITPTIVMKTQVFNNLITPLSRVFWSWLDNKPFIVDSLSIDYEYEQCDANLVEMKQPSDESISIERVNSTRNLYRTRDIIFNGHIARRNTGILQLAIPINTDVNNPANTDTPVILSTNDDMAGNSSLNIDWATGQARLSTSPVSGVSASNNGGQVVITLQ